MGDDRHDGYVNQAESVLFAQERMRARFQCTFDDRGVVVARQDDNADLGIPVRNMLYQLDAVAIAPARHEEVDNRYVTFAASERLFELCRICVATYHFHTGKIPGKTLD